LKTNKKRGPLLYKIIYSNSSFNRAVNNESPIKPINFLVQTFINSKHIAKEKLLENRMQHQNMLTFGKQNTENTIEKQ